MTEPKPRSSSRRTKRVPEDGTTREAPASAELSTHVPVDPELSTRAVEAAGAEPRTLREVVELGRTDPERAQRILDELKLGSAARAAGMTAGLVNVGKAADAMAQVNKSVEPMIGMLKAGDSIAGIAGSVKTLSGIAGSAEQLANIQGSIVKGLPSLSISAAMAQQLSKQLEANNERYEGLLGMAAGTAINARALASAPPVPLFEAAPPVYHDYEPVELVPAQPLELEAINALRGEVTRVLGVVANVAETTVPLLEVARDANAGILRLEALAGATREETEKLREAMAEWKVAGDKASHRLEILTRWLIALTVVLVAATIALVVLAMQGTRA